MENIYEEYKIINPLPAERHYFRRSVEEDKKTTKKTKIVLTSSKTEKKGQFKTPEKEKSNSVVDEIR